MRQANPTALPNSNSAVQPKLVGLKIEDEAQIKTVSQLLQSCDITLVNDADISIGTFVDGRGLACPQPLLKTKIGLRVLPTSTYLYMVATDSNSMHDMIAFAKQKKLNLLNWQGNGVFHFLIK